MNRRLTAISVIILALIILIGLVYFMFLAPVFEAAPAAPKPAATTPPVAQEVVPPPAPVVRNRTVARRVVGEDELKRVAAAFVERFGSYSNQSGYQNIRELDVFMSRSMQMWATNYITQTSESHPDTSIYYGITTKAVVVTTDSFSPTATTASFTVQTQRQEAIGASANERTFQQDALVALVKESGIWKVDRVMWEE